MFIPIGARVQCKDGSCGHSTYIVINPVLQTITDVVVKATELSHRQRLVPVKHVVSSTADEIRLDCSRADLKSMKPFLSLEYIPGTLPHLDYAPEQYLLMPYGLPPVGMASNDIPVEHEQIPPEELAIRRGARVETRDGPIGHVSEFLVNPANGHISHLVLHKGHLWNKHEIAIPVTYIEFIAEGAVYLTIGKDSVQGLSPTPE